MSSTLPDFSLESPATQFTSQPQSWKSEVNSRLAAHRSRRVEKLQRQESLPGIEDARREEEDSARPKARSVAARVAARYAQAPTYSEMLATEARNAARAAQNAATAAAEARDAAQAILIGLDVDRDPYPETPLPTSSQPPAPRPHEYRAELPAELQRHPQPTTLKASGNYSDALAGQIKISASGVADPIQEETITPVQPLPAKLLEFPREVVATRRARPRLAEGPLREESGPLKTPNSEGSQLRIFEVEPETISTRPEVDHVASGWSAIRLDAHPLIEAESAGKSSAHATLRHEAATFAPALSNALHHLELPLQTASLEDRLMAGIVDLALIALGFLVFVFVFAASASPLPVGTPAQIAAATVFFLFGCIYQAIFFTLGHDTPGMRYAKIALCTFDDENPTPKMVRQRLLGALLSTVSLGLGLIWALFDDDRLGWHDRISRTYQRSYR